MEPFRWRRALFLGLVSSTASLAGLVVDTFVPVLLQAGHPLWHNPAGLHALLRGFALAPSLMFFIMTWDNLLNMVVHPWAGVRNDHTWTPWGRRPISANLPLFPCVPPLLHAAFCRLPGWAQTRWSSQVRTGDA
jgi:hypothetical protein